jgi:hypothetical protein
MDPLGQIVEVLGGRMPSCDQVRALEDVILQLPQVDLDAQTVTHGQVSARAIFIPAGTVLTGAQTNLDNVCIVFGDIEVSTGDGGSRRITGFAMLPANRGAKRVGRTFADTWWVTVHHTKQIDQSAIEDEMTNESHRLQTRRPMLCQSATPEAIEFNPIKRWEAIEP